jgi:hypothetical protein
MRTYKPKPPRPPVTCPCGAEFTPAPKGPIPTRCRGCRAAARLTEMAVKIVGRDVSAVDAVRVARTLDAASKRIKRRVGVLT